MNSKNLLNFTESVDVEENKDKVIEFLSLVQRQGIDDLLDYLESTNFYQSPASSRYHSVFTGGLVQHSLTRLSKIVKKR